MMKVSLIFSLMLVSQSLFAQAIPCDMRNPHSYDCTWWTFKGNPVFPLFKVSVKSVKGTWTPLTYADRVYGNNSPDFVMLVLPQRPSIPTGVIDKVTGAQLGNLVIESKSATLANWRGQILRSNEGSLHTPDAFTLKFMVTEGKYSHTFNCRDFNRNDKHHLLCAWDLLRPESKGWEHRGVIGFSKAN